MNATATQLRLDGYDAVGAVRNGLKTAGVAGARLAIDLERAKEAARFSDPNDSMKSLSGKVAMVIAPLSAVSGAVKSVTQVGTALDALEAWQRDGTSSTRDRAIGATAKASITVAGTVFASAETYVLGRKLLVTYQAASSAFSSAVPTASREMTHGLAWAATKHLLETGGRPTEAVSAALKARGAELGFRAAALDASLIEVATPTLKSTLREAAKAVGEKTGVALAESLGVGSRAAAREALSDGIRAASSAGVAASARAATGTIAKGLARFAPGLNVAIAALDTAQAYATLKDPDASLGKKVCGVITALGAWVSATNLPAVSQTGALVSIVSAFAGAFL